MRTLIHEDLFFNMLIIDDHKIDFLLIDHFLTFTRLFDGEENISRTWLKDDQILFFKNNHQHIPSMCLKNIKTISKSENYLFQISNLKSTFSNFKTN